MKKSLLTLGLLGLGSSAFAQTPLPVPTPGPWVTVNTTSVASTPNFRVDQLVTISPTFCWAVLSEAVAGSTRTNVMTPNNAAGTQFDFNSITGSAGFQAASLDPVNTTTAFCAQFGAGVGGEIIRTTNTGATWRKVTNATHFAPPAGFANFVHMFDANVGVALGDPNPLPAGGGPGQFEIIRTTNGAAAAPTWTRVTTNVPTALSADEYGIVDSYTFLGNTVWAGTNHEIGGVAAPVRCLRSTDRGLTWNAYNTPLVGTLPQLAFKDQNNGIALSRTATSTDLIRTTDGGVTWTSVALPMGRDTLRGKFYHYTIDAVPGVGFFSAGQSSASSSLLSFNFGVSFSRDGITWTDIEKGVRSYTSVDFINCGTNPTATNLYQGYLGGFTARPTATTPGGQGGLYQVAPATCAVLSAKRNSELQRSLTVSPNPSTGGVFNVSLASGIKAGTVLAVFDVMGRMVSTRTLNATAVDAKTVTLDLSGQKTGVYTLRLSDASGIATEKIVIE